MTTGVWTETNMAGEVPHLWQTHEGGLPDLAPRVIGALREQRAQLLDDFDTHIGRTGPRPRRTDWARLPSLGRTGSLRQKIDGRLYESTEGDNVARPRTPVSPNHRGET